MRSEYTNIHTQRTNCTNPIAIITNRKKKHEEHQDENSTTQNVFLLIRLSYS